MWTMIGVKITQSRGEEIEDSRPNLPGAATPTSAVQVQPGPSGQAAVAQGVSICLSIRPYVFIV